MVLEFVSVEDREQARQRRAREVRCPKCYASARSPCMDARGICRKVHRERLERRALIDKRQARHDGRVRRLRAQRTDAGV